MICWKTFAVRHQYCIVKVYCLSYVTGKRFGLSINLATKTAKLLHREGFAIAIRYQ